MKAVCIGSRRNFLPLMKGRSKMIGSYAFMKLEQPFSLDELTWREMLFHKSIA